MLKSLAYLKPVWLQQLRQNTGQPEETHYGAQQSQPYQIFEIYNCIWCSCHWQVDNIIHQQWRSTEMAYSHTCGYTLEVPSRYASFCVLRGEFKAILNSDIWEMNIEWTNSINVHHKEVSPGYLCILLGFICSQTVQLQCNFMLSYVFARMVCLLTIHSFLSCGIIKAAQCEFCQKNLLMELY